MTREHGLQLGIAGLACCALLLTLRSQILAASGGSQLFTIIYDGWALAAAILLALAGFYFFLRTGR